MRLTGSGGGTAAFAAAIAGVEKRRGVPIVVEEWIFLALRFESGEARGKESEVCREREERQRVGERR